MKYSIIYLFCLFCLFGCKEEGRLDHIDDSAPSPTQVVVEQVINYNGYAVIKYKIPSDKNLLGVKAVYERSPGVISEAKASLYVDSLTVEGFGRVGTYPVKLYSVGMNEKLSEPVLIDVRPLTPPVLATVKEIEETFGGVSVHFSNPSRADLAMVLMTNIDGSSLWTNLQTFYTKAEKGVFSRRGMDSKEQVVAVYVRDRWNNKSDTLVAHVTPIMEEVIPKSKFTNQMLPGDTYAPAENSAAYGMSSLWDDVWNSRQGIFANAHTSPMPQHFTINLGLRTVISRFKIYQRPGSDEYASSSPRTFQLWGSDNPPGDGSWNNWYLLGEWEAFKPSGYEADGSVGAVTADDKNYACVEGIDCEIVPSDNIPNPFREVTHLRFKTLSTYNTHGTTSPTGQIIICELTFWGQIK